jgi:hypothetical protein
MFQTNSIAAARLEKKETLHVLTLTSVIILASFVQVMETM